MTSDGAKPDFRGSILDRMVIVVGLVCAAPLIGALGSLAADNALLALMILMLAAPLLVIWLMLAFLMAVYRRRPTKWTLISAAAPALLLVIGAVWVALVLLQLV